MNAPACAPKRGPIASEGNWRWCAEDYLCQIWWPQDRALVRSFSAAINCELIGKLFGLYRVARTVPGSGSNRYQPFVDVLNKYRNTVLTIENTGTIIENESSNLGQFYGQRPLSALSKAFWMVKNHPVAIYDNFAWEGLRKLGLTPGYEGYRTYYISWFRFFERSDTQRALDDAVEWLPESPFASSLITAGQVDLNTLKNLANSLLFRNRVTDRWLTYKGGVKEFK